MTITGQEVKSKDLTPLTKKLITRASKIFVNYPLVVLLAAVFATVFLYPNTVALFQNVRTDFAALLPKDYPSVKRVEEMGERFGSIKKLIIVFETSHKEVIQKMFADFANEVQQVPGVKKIIYTKPGYDFFAEHKLLYLSKDDLSEIKNRLERRIQGAKLGGLYIDFEDDNDSLLSGKLDKDAGFQLGSNLSSPYLTNKAEDIFLFEVYPAVEAGTNVKASRDFFAKIAAKVVAFQPERYAPDIKILYSGGVKGMADEYNSIIRDLQVAGTISWVLILIFLMQYFRSFSLTIATFIPLIIGMIWGFGLCYIVVGQLNMITAFLFSVLAGLGIENGIHLTTRYFEERRAGKSPQDSIAVMLTSTGRPAFMAAATTVGTMSVMLISDFRGFSEFGGIMAVGIIFIFLSYVLLLGPLLILLERWRIITNLAATATHLIDPLFFMKRWTKMRYVRPILVVSLVALVFSLWAMLSKVQFDYNFSKLNEQTPDIVQVKSKTDDIYQASIFPAVLWVENQDQARDVKNELTRYTKNDRTPTIKNVITLADLIPKDQNDKLDILKEIRALLADPLLKKISLSPEKKKLIDDLKKSSRTKEVSLEQIPSSVTDMFYGVHRAANQQFVFVIPSTTLDLEDGRDSIAFAADTRDIRIGNKTYHAVSHNLIFADLLIMLLKDMKTVIAFAAFAAFLLLWLDFRRVDIAVLVMLPLLVGIIWMCGCMWLVPIKLNLFNIVVFPCLLGMSIDNATHIFYRVKETGIENMIQVLRMTGNSVVMSVLTAISGFAGLIIAHNRGLYSTGILAEIGLVTTLVSALIFFPAFLQWLSSMGLRIEDGQ